MNGSRLTIAVFIALFFRSPDTSAQPSSQPAANRPRDYADGIRIDWSRSVVELDATVCLRQGALELLACSPHTKEHESIVVLHARPLHIYEALGLIGLEPGAPPTYDPATDRSTPARGAPLRIDVTFALDGKEKTCGIHQWMRTAKDHQPMLPRDWVFAGSRKLDGNRFAADGEGTLICVVDFDTALIAMPESHTSDDADLWLEADTDKIPPRGTKCVVHISSADRGRTIVQVDELGLISIDGPGKPAHTALGEIDHRLLRALDNDAGANLLIRTNSAEAMSHAATLRKIYTKRGFTVFWEATGPASQPASRPAAGMP